MVQSKAATVDLWFEDVAPDRRAALMRLRETCRAHLPGWEERMQWGMPGYGPPGSDALVSFNSQKAYIALYVGGTAIASMGNALEGIDRGQSCLRYRRPAQMDFAVIGDMLDFIRVNGRPGR